MAYGILESHYVLAGNFLHGKLSTCVSYIQLFALSVSGVCGLFRNKDAVGVKINPLIVFKYLIGFRVKCFINKYVIHVVIRLGYLNEVVPLRQIVTFYGQMPGTYSGDFQRV